MTTRDSSFHPMRGSMTFSFTGLIPKSPTSRQCTISWKNPSTGTVLGMLKKKIYRDFSSSEQSRCVVIISRDDNGMCVGGRFEKVLNASFLEQVEALAGRQGLCVVCLAQELQLLTRTEHIHFLFLL